MIKILTLIMSFCIISTAGFASKVEKNSSENTFNIKLQKQLKVDTKRAAYYQKKSEKLNKKSGKAELAAAYKECAIAKKDSSNALEAYFSAKNKAESIISANPKLSGYDKNIINYYNKGEHLKTRIKKLSDCSSKLAASKDEKSQELSTNLDVMAKSLEKYIDAKDKFKAENTNVLNLKKNK